MNSIVGVMKRVAQQEVGRILTAELGVVKAVFPHAAEDDKDNYQCTVALKNYQTAEGQDFELKKVPVCTTHMGLACIPNVGSLVLLNFMGGDINAPVIVGQLYNDEERPPPNKDKEFLLQHNHLEGGSLKIDAEGVITITSKDDKNSFTLSDETIAIKGEKYQLSIDTKGNKITIEADQDIAIQSTSGKLQLKGKTIEIDSQSDCTLKSGGKAIIESTADCTIKAGGKAAVSGTKVEIN